MSLTPEIVDESEVTALAGDAIYAAVDVAEGVAPCRKMAAPANKNRLNVVFDTQFSNRPTCCQLKNLASGDTARVFKKREKRASERRNISSYTTDGIRFGEYSGVVYSMLEPTSVPCSETHQCPVVVEIPGAATVPWLLLQAWCTGCALDLGTIVVSVDYVEDPSRHFAESVFVPLVNQFLDSRTDVDRGRVYLSSTSKGNEIGLMAALLHPELFAFCLFSGKFFISEHIVQAAQEAKAPATGVRLKKVSFQVGSKDKVHDDDQDFWSKLQEVVKPLDLPTELELRYYSGGTHVMWYAGWNVYRDLLWTGTAYVSSYLRSLSMTCTPK